VYEATKRNARNKNAITYDAVVLDAPPTGRIAQFLGVNHELAGLARMGPIKSQADSVTTLFHSKRTAVHLVTVLEEMPVQETTDGIAELRKHDLPVGGGRGQPRCVPATSTTTTWPRSARARSRSASSRRPSPARVSAATPRWSWACWPRLATTPSGGRWRMPQRALVDELDVPTYELPLLVGGVDLGALYELAGMLREQGLA
jgi:hypothetical protein